MKIDLFHLKQLFNEQYQQQPSNFVQAPARVNLIGEHTDYNDGFVLPCAIGYHTVVACRPRTDDIVNVYADNFSENDSFTISTNIEPSSKLWANYVRGVVQFLAVRGYAFTGADMVITGNVPQGAGLSSSASLEVAIGQTFKTLYQLNISQAEIALNGQQAENEYVGCNCGIMDQLISAQGIDGKALFIDCRDLSTQTVQIPDSLAVMIINSNKQRGLVDSEYNTRREQCETASQILGKPALRDATLEDLRSTIVKDSDIYRRAHHVITENDRTLAMVNALEQSDIASISKLMADSHISMRDDFDITVHEINYLVDIIGDVIGNNGGVRMTGGGFGGCVVVLVPHEKIADVKQKITDNYTQKTGLVADIYLCKPSAGSGEIFD